MGRRLARAVCCMVVVAAVLPASASAQSPFAVSLFARVPEPGQPEGITVDDRTVYVGTNNAGDGMNQPKRPSKIFAYDDAGRLIRDYTVSGQDTSNNLYGVYGLAADSAGNVYFADRVPPRIVKLDPRTGAQSVYARFPDIPPCPPVNEPDQCSRTVGDQPPFPNGLAFAPDGSLYVTDAAQAGIWRILEGGGQPRLVRSDPKLEAAIAGPNGIVIDPPSMIFAQSNFPPGPPPDHSNGRIYRLPLSGRGDLEVVWEGRPMDVPDGITRSPTGRLWVALAGPDQVAVVAPDGREIARVGNDNSDAEVPFDKPASVAFLDDRVLVTNQSLFNRDPSHWAVLAINAAEPRDPVVPGGPGRLEVSVRPRRVRKGRRVRFRVKVTTTAGLPVRGARVALGRKRARTNARGVARLRRVRVHVTGRRKVVVRAAGYPKKRAFYRVLSKRRR